MKTIYLLLLVTILMACEQPGASNDQAKVAPDLKAKPRLVVFGDDFTLASGSFVNLVAASMGATAINYGRSYDGSNGAMLGGIQNLWTGIDIKAGDKVIFMAGLFDAKWYGTSDPGNQAKTYFKQVMAQLILKGCTVYVATVPRLPAIGYTTGAPLANGSDNASDFYSNVIRTGKSELANANVILVEANTGLSQVGSNWNAGGTALSTAGNQALAELFYNLMK